MKNFLTELITQSLNQLIDEGIIPSIPLPEIKIEHTKDKRHGDFACNCALILSRELKMNPRELAEKIISHLPKSQGKVQKVDIAGPGFINFFATQSLWQDVIHTILSQGPRYGQASKARGEKINLEYVSSNPTGPLHVGHGRSAAYGSVLANLLEAIGYSVHREYYVNDAGRQMDILATSVWLRYLALCGENFIFPSNGYKGDYVNDIAQSLINQYAEAFLHPTLLVFENIAPDEPAGGDKEKHIDDLIARCKKLLGDADYMKIFNITLDTILADIKNDLTEFGVTYDEWFSERSLFTQGFLTDCIQRLKDTKYTYEKDGNLWFQSTEFGDEKDRVLIRKNGQPTYFAADIANHLGKFTRGADKLINIFGSDHHGYVPRIKAALAALGYEPSKLDVPLVQFVTLFRGNDRVQMSTRSGSFVPLRELREEVGNDAARFFYVMRKTEHHLEFDLELAKSQSTDNPVYYIQYAHARICSVFKQLQERQLQFDKEMGLQHLNLLTSEYEKLLSELLSRYPEIIEAAATQYEPHLLTHYLRDVAHQFHTYYNASQFLVEENTLRNARLCLVTACQYVLKNGLTLLGISAPETMQRNTYEAE